MNNHKIKTHKNRHPCRCKLISVDLLSIFIKYNKKKDFLADLLRDIIDKFGIITEEDIICITEYMNIPEKAINETLKKHPEFEIKPVKQRLIRVCNGIICQVRGSAKIIEAASEELEIPPGTATEDGKFKLETVKCVGLCDIAPIIAVNNTFYGRVEESDVTAILAHEKQKLNRNY